MFIWNPGWIIIMIKLSNMLLVAVRHKHDDYRNVVQSIICDYLIFLIHINIVFMEVKLE